MEVLLLTSTVGKEVAVRSVSLVATTLYHTVTGAVALMCQEDGFQQATQDMAQLHLGTDIQLIQAMLQDLEARDQVDPLAKQKVVGVALQHLHIALKELEKELSQFQEAMQAHKQKWLVSYRTFDAAAHMGPIRRKKEILDHCFDQFMRVHQLVHHQRVDAEHS